MVSRLKINSKTNKSNIPYDNITIDAKHNEMINYFSSLNDSIPSLKEELKKLVNEYNNKDQSRKHDIEYILYRDSIKDKIYEIKDRINKIINNDDINKYYLEVGTLLHNYYENVENSKTNENLHSENFEENLLNYDNYFDTIEEDDIEKNNDDNEEDEDDEDEKDIIKETPNSKIKSNNILNFFNSTNLNNTNSKNTNPKNNDFKNNNSSAYTSTKISDFVKEESKFKKKDILDEYLQKIDPKYITKIKIDHSIFKCSSCKSEMTIFPSDGIQICEACGYQQNIFIESDKPSFKDPPIEVCYFTYKRVNHFNELHKRQKIYINEYNYFISKIVYLLKIIQII
jgi:hypothetical protein